MDVLIINYKTPKLTEAAVLSVRKHSPNFRITVYDNSNDYFGSADRIIKNDIDFDLFLNQYPNKLPTNNNWGSAKHAYTIEHCFQYFNEGFILLDSDVLVKKDITELWQPDKIWVGQPHNTKKHKIRIPRLYPFCCFINSKMCKEKGIHYFNEEYMWFITNKEPNLWYDTGAWFLKTTRNLPCTKIKVNNYIIHYGSGSFCENKEITPDEWLEQNKELYLNVI